MRRCRTGPPRCTFTRRGLFPLWEDTILGGQPFAANPLNKVAYPPQWLALILPPALHLNLLLVLHLLLAGWGMARWLKQMGLREEAALFGALAYALAPKVIAHLGAGHLDLLYALAWWPWLMAAVRRLVRQGRYVAVYTALIAALLILADVRLGLFALSLAAAYGLWTAAQNRRGPAASGAASGSGAGAAADSLAHVAAAGLAALFEPGA